MKMNMKKSVKMTLLALAGAVVMVGAGVLTGCNPNYGKPETRTFAVGDYTAIDASNAWEIEMVEGATVATVTLDELLFDHLVFEVRVINGVRTLVIELTGWQTGNIKSKKIVLPMNEELRKVSLSGACQITILDETELEEVHLSGASKADILGAGNMKEMSLSGASKADISGQGDEMKIDISGASKLEAEKLYLSAVEGSVSGASSINVTICSGLEVVASGASHILYGLVSQSCDPEIDCELTGSSYIEMR